jgi:hypothetical protein
MSASNWNSGLKEVRKATLASILTKARPGIRLNEHIEGDGPTVFAHACKMGVEAQGLAFGHF